MTVASKSECEATADLPLNCITLIGHQEAIPLVAKQSNYTVVYEKVCLLDILKQFFFAIYGFIFDRDSEDWHESGGKERGENMRQSAAVPRLAVLSRIRNMVACSFQWAKPAPSNKSLLHALGMATEHVLVTPIPVSTILGDKTK